MVKTKLYILAAWLLLVVTGCGQVEKDMLAAPNGDSFDRYGLDTVKLGDKRAEVGKQLQALLAQPLQCNAGKNGMGDTHKAYATEACAGVAVNGQVGTLWGEKITQLSAVFVENQLCSLTVQLQTSGDYEALYDKHGQKIINLFGKPDEIGTKAVWWQRSGDEVRLQDLGKGAVSVDIRNKAVMSALHHQGG
jgi:hypothetical protein